MKMLMVRIPLSRKRTGDWRKNVVRNKERDGIAMRNIQTKMKQVMIDRRNPNRIKTGRNLGGYVPFSFPSQYTYFSLNTNVV